MSGITLSQIILKFIANGFDINNLKTCALFYNSEQNFTVDYFTRKLKRSVNTEWIHFPWE